MLNVLTYINWRNLWLLQHILPVAGLGSVGGLVVSALTFKRHLHQFLLKKFFFISARLQLILNFQFISQFNDKFIDR